MAKMDKDDLKYVIKRSRKLFKGEEIPKVHGYEGENNKYEKKEIGEIWTDSDGKEWKQIGDNTKVRTETLFDKVRKSLREAPNCPKEVCTCDPSKYLDKKMLAKKGMCFDCVYEYEQKLKDEGKYEAYEKKTMLENERSFLFETRTKLVESKKYINDDPEFLNENGTLEQWTLPDKSKVINDLENDLEELEKRLREVETDLLEYENIKF